ncbi:MAG: four-carbon acid sugar kinase family protein [Burkholderiales bacterium]|nr:MAG: four-carbon acid sugar kinase family protein [Burkholderiales bacterium]
MPMLLGCIADDFTGATDLAGTIANAGLTAVQVNGVPETGLRIDPADAVVVALKSRTIEAASAVAQSLAALAWLRSQGAQRFYFKVCSTFDSTPAGNIGPVADALCEALGARLNVVTPAYPRNARTVYQGHLFVGESLLSDTGMRTHPLTPMTDSNLVRVLAAQTPRRVGLLPHAVTARGPAAVAAQLESLAADGCRHVIADAIDDAQLELLGAVLAPQWLATGGSGLAAGMAAALRTRATAAGAAATGWPSGPGVILAGSCSAATLAQIERVKDALPRLRLDPVALHRDRGAAAAALDWARARLGERPLLIYASAPPEQVAAAQAALGREQAAQVVEDALRTIAVGLAAAGARRFVVAGGETSGAVVEALGVRALAIGPEIAPGVPWTRAADGKPYALALKSGNFGGPDFFTRAFELAP